MEQQPSVANLLTNLYAAETQTDTDTALADALEKNKLLEVNEALRSELDDLEREIRKLNFQMKNCRFQIEDFKSNNKDIEFYTGFTCYDMMLVCYSLIENKANNLNYDKKENPESSTHSHSPRVGRPRSLTKFQEFVMVLIRLRLGLFERDLGQSSLWSVYWNCFCHVYNMNKVSTSRVWPFDKVARKGNY
jgi:hypothetical protein